jgi:hypothetical protein
MKVLKSQSNYLQLKAKEGKERGFILITLGGMGVAASFLLINTLIFLPFFFITICLLLWGLSSFQENVNYNRGFVGEDVVSHSLMHLGDEYYLISDIKFSSNSGNIDHVILGPNGIFVLETKNYGGTVECVGDEWTKYYDKAHYQKFYEIRSPSKQVKRNAIIIKKLIESTNILDKSINFWVDGIVVFVDSTLILRLINPTIPILRPNQLYNYIINRPTKNKFSPQELESMAQMIINRSRM